MNRLLAMAAVAVSLVAGPACAATYMAANFSGSFNDNPWFDGWGVQLEYDTELGTVSSGPGFVDLTWDISDGTPSPLRALLVDVHSQGFVRDRDVFGDQVAPSYHHWFTDFTHFEIHITPDVYGFRVQGPALTQVYDTDIGWQGLEMSYGETFLSPNFAVDLNAAQSAIPVGYPSWYVSTFLTPDPRFTAGGPLVYGMGVGPGSAIIEVPEPATWALLVVAFGLMGSALRVRRLA